MEGEREGRSSSGRGSRVGHVKEGVGLKWKEAR